RPRSSARSQHAHVLLDVVKAYKVITVALEDRHLQGEFHGDAFFWSNVPNFGCKSSGDIFDDIGTILEFIFRYHSPADAISRYVDDLGAFVAPLPDGR